MTAPDLQTYLVPGGILTAAVTFAEIVKKLMNARNNDQQGNHDPQQNQDGNPLGRLIGRMDRLDVRIDGQDARLDSHSTRIHKLYQWARSQGYDGSA